MRRRMSCWRRIKPDDGRAGHRVAACVGDLDHQQLGKVAICYRRLRATGDEGDVRRGGVGGALLKVTVGDGRITIKKLVMSDE